MVPLPINAREAANWMRSEREQRGWSTTTLADKAREFARRDGSTIALPQQSISNFEQGDAKRLPEWLRYVRMAFESDEIGGPEQHAHQHTGGTRPSKDSPDQPSPRTVDGGETAPVLRLDLSYSMGPGTTLDDSYIDGEAFQFDIGFLRALTITPPDRLRIVDGVGTSMEPTFHDRDLLLIDINQRDLNAQDRVWACWIFGLGAVKRLRAVAEDRVLVISDNPDVENQEVSRKDILIHGRVVGSIKRH